MPIFTDRRFMPLFITQFFGAFNDNFLKNALILLVTLHPEIVGGVARGDLAINLFSAVFIAPYFLFSLTAGQLSDKFPRDLIARRTKIWELGLMLLAGLALYIPSPVPMAALLFLMGMQSTFFSPAKYATLPQLLSEKELVGANALLEAGTYLAIIGGTLAGSILMKYPCGKPVVWGLLLLFAVIGYIASRAIPRLPPVDPGLTIDRNPAAGTGRLIREAARLPEVFFAIIAGSWFWVLGIVLLAQIPSLCKNTLHVPGAIPVFLMIFTLGIGLGAFIAGRAMRGIVQTTPVPFAALGMALSLIPLAGACETFAALHPQATPAAQLFRAPEGRAILISLLAAATACGAFIVPLNTLIQYASPKQHVARMVAANNIVNALAMAAASLTVMLLLKAGISVTGVIRVTGWASLAVLLILAALRPADILRGIFQLLLTPLFRVGITGHSHYTQAGPRTLVIANHVSLLDGILLAAYIPDRLGFAIDTAWAAKWYIRALAPLVNFYPVDPHSSGALRAMITQLQADRPCVIFPEGRITTDGALSPIQPGAAFIAARAQAAILPIAIAGAGRSFLSYQKQNRRPFPRITLTLLPPIPHSGQNRDSLQQQIETAMRAIQQKATP